MAAPLKPWERNGVNFHSSSDLPSSNGFPCEGGGQNTYVDSLTNVVGVAAAPSIAYGGPRALPVPALPPRPAPLHHTTVTPMAPTRPSLPFSSTSIGGYGYSVPYTTGFNSYGIGPTPYGSSGYRGYNPSFVSSDPYASSVDAGGFIQLAEEGSRPAFQSIESIVHAVSSVSMMLESTYFAMYSSFRAVIGVAHHFTQMRTQFAQIFSALALIRSLRWLYWKALHLMGLLGRDPSVENVWANIANEVNSPSGCLGENDLKQARSNWPFVMFVTIVFGTPWIIWKLLTSVTRVAIPKVSEQWMSGGAEHYVAVAQYDFSAESDREVSFHVGQTIRLAPKELQPRIRGWLLASVDGKHSGLVPANYLRILGKKQQVTIPEESCQDKPHEDKPFHVAPSTSDEPFPSSGGEK